MLQAGEIGLCKQVLEGGAGTLDGLSELEVERRDGREGRAQVDQVVGQREVQYGDLAAAYLEDVSEDSLLGAGKLADHESDGLGQ